MRILPPLQRLLQLYRNPSRLNAPRVEMWVIGNQYSSGAPFIFHPIRVNWSSTLLLQRKKRAVVETSSTVTAASGVAACSRKKQRSESNAFEMATPASATKKRKKKSCQPTVNQRKTTTNENQRLHQEATIHTTEHFRPLVVSLHPNRLKPSAIGPMALFLWRTQLLHLDVLLMLPLHQLLLRLRQFWPKLLQKKQTLRDSNHHPQCQLLPNTKKTRIIYNCWRERI